MNSDAFWVQLNNLILQAGMNHDYYQQMSDSYAWWNRLTTVVVVALTVITLYFGVRLIKKHKDGPTWRIVEFAGAFIPVALLVFPFCDWRNEMDKFAVQWGTVKGSVDELKLDFANLPKKDPLPNEFPSRLGKIMATISEIQKTEPQPNSDLVQKCYADQLQKVYGHGITTTKAAREKVEEDAARPSSIPDQAPAPMPPNEPKAS